MVASSAEGAAVRVLDADPELAEALHDEELEEARRTLVAPTLTLAKGDWSPRGKIREANQQLGLLVVGGLLCREVAIGNTVCAELVGTGDLLRPWDGANASALVPHDVRWHVLEQARLALLGRRFASAAACWPALTSAFVARAMNRSQGLALSAAITCTTGIETRLSMLFWHLADRWGRVCRDGVLVPLPLTHELIGRLIGARRPSVSTALKQLEREGSIVRAHSGGWLLAGEPPCEVLQIGARRSDPVAAAVDPRARAAEERGCVEGTGARRRCAPPSRCVKRVGGRR